MSRSRLLPWFFSIGLLLATACSDSVSPVASSGAAAAPTTPVSPSFVTLTGSVHVSGEDLYPVWIHTSDGQDIHLTGASANMLLSVDNATVDVRGRWETDGANEFFVKDFLVREVNGNSVIDGTLVALYPLITDDGEPLGYAIRPTAGGSDILLSDPSPDLLTHLNERIWLAGANGGGATAYGVIGPQPY